MRISDWSSDVCSSDLNPEGEPFIVPMAIPMIAGPSGMAADVARQPGTRTDAGVDRSIVDRVAGNRGDPVFGDLPVPFARPRRVDRGGAPDGHVAGGVVGADAARWRCRVSGVVSGYTGRRSEEHTSELQSLMRISYAVF